MKESCKEGLHVQRGACNHMLVLMPHITLKLCACGHVHGHVRGRVLDERIPAHKGMRVRTDTGVRAFLRLCICACLHLLCAWSRFWTDTGSHTFRLVCTHWAHGHIHTNARTHIHKREHAKTHTGTRMLWPTGSSLQLCSLTPANTTSSSSSRHCRRACTHSSHRPPPSPMQVRAWVHER